MQSTTRDMFVAREMTLVALDRGGGGEMERFQVMTWGFYSRARVERLLWAIARHYSEGALGDLRLLSVDRDSCGRFLLVVST